MNNNEAISQIKFLLDVGGSDGFTSRDKEALNMAIDALSTWRQHGQWIDSTSRGSYSIYCSCCGSHKETICPSDYCPSCGAKMDAQNRGVNND